jgi:hypothetical protein
MTFEEMVNLQGIHKCCKRVFKIGIVRSDDNYKNSFYECSINKM